MERHKIIMTAEQMGRTLERLAFEVLERHGPGSPLALIGVQRRGAELAQRLKTVLCERLGRAVPLGKLDINLYRDDWTKLSVQPSLELTDIPFDIRDLDIILVDDVLFTGRTVRAALEAILDYGRPRKVEFLALIDRGGRELPIQADYVGKRVSVPKTGRVDVFVSERDGEDKVVLTGIEGESGQLTLI
jgi:pyrimidine operon attenuation protein / uracil phosphoribosyltransferase